MVYFFESRITQKMGRSTEATVDVLTKNVQQAITTSMMNCKTSVNATVGLDISGDNNKISDVDMSQEVEFSMECFSQADTRSSMASAITNAITSTVNQKDQGILASLTGGKTKSSVRIANEVTNVLEDHSTLDCITQIVANNTIRISGSGNEVTKVKINQAIKGVADCVMTKLLQSETIAQAVNNADAITTRESKGVDLNLLGGLFEGGTLMLVGGAIAVLVFVYLLVSALS